MCKTDGRRKISIKKREFLKLTALFGAILCSFQTKLIRIHMHAVSETSQPSFPENFNYNTRFVVIALFQTQLIWLDVKHLAHSFKDNFHWGSRTCLKPMGTYMVPISSEHWSGMAAWLVLRICLLSFFTMFMVWVGWLALLIFMSKEDQEKGNG